MKSPSQVALFLKVAGAAFRACQTKCGMKGILALFSSYLIPDLGDG